MDMAQIVSTVFGAGGIITGLVAWYKAKSTKQVGLSGVEVQDKAQVTADWSQWQTYWPDQIKRLDAELAGLKGEIKSLREAREQDAKDHSAERRQWYAERDHLNELLDERDRWIYEGKPPPPPERRPYEPPTERGT